MDLVWIVYFSSSLGNIRGTILFLVIAFCTMSLVYVLTLCGEHNVKFTEAFAKVKKVLVVCSIAITIFCITPGRDARHMMIAAYAGQQISQMEGTKEVGTKAYKALNKILDEYLEEGEEK